MLFNIVKGWLFSPLRMMLKLAFWGLLVSFILITIFLLTFDLNFLKGRIEATASTVLRNEFKINGDIKLGTQGFSPSLILHDVKVGKDGKTTVTLADRLEVTLPLQMPNKDDPFSFFANLENLRIDGKPLGDYDLPVKFSKRGIEISSAKGGRDKSRLEANASLLDGKFHLDAKISKLDYEELESGVSDGNFSGDILLDSRGPEHIENLSGHVMILGGDGKLEGDSLGFWAGDLLKHFLSSPKKETNLRCAVVSFDIEKGKAQSRAVIIDTDDITIFGTGTIDLARGYVDMLFTPKPKNMSLLSLGTPMRVRGHFGAVQTTPDPAGVATKLGGFLLGALTPAAALLPLMSMGTGVDNPCLKYLEAQ